MVKCEFDADSCNARRAPRPSKPVPSKRLLSPAQILSAVASVLLAAIPHVSAASDTSDAVVQKGRYLAIAGNCATCHTVAGGQPFAGGLAFKTPFGTMYSTNISPDPDTGIGKWSQEEFARAVREGVRPDGEHLYPAFPYTAYTKLTDADVAALFAYLKTVAPVNSAATENEMSFPFNQRWALSLWKMLFFSEGRFVPNQSKPADWNRGAYLVEGLGHCSSCHSPRNFMGAEQSSMAMTGGEYPDKVPGVDLLRPWSAPNLTSAPNGLKSWTVDDLTAYLHTGGNDFSETFGPMNEVIINSTRNMTEADVRAMATYLKSLPANPGATGSPASAQVLQDGETLYNVHCGTCHLPTGLGSQAEDAGARLVGSPIVQAGNPASLINNILYGPQVPIPPMIKRWKPMQAFSDKLADEEVAAIASYVRSAWGNTGGAVTAEQVAKQR